MPFSPNVKRIQQLLRDRHGQQIQPDGYYGPNTERAILNALESDERDEARAEGEGMVARPVDKIKLDWRTQFDPAYRLDLLREGGDTIGKSGCLSACCAMILGVTVPEFVAEMQKHDGYTEESELRWGAVEAAYGVEHEDRIGIDVGLEHLESGTPVILRYRSGHFTVAIGSEGNNRFRVLDPGKGIGNGNELTNDVTVVPFHQVIRVDVLI